jgi:hypothetical protein
MSATQALEFALTLAMKELRWDSNPLATPIACDVNQYLLKLSDDDQIASIDSLYKIGLVDISYIYIMTPFVSVYEYILRNYYDDQLLTILEENIESFRDLNILPVDANNRFQLLKNREANFGLVPETNALHVKCTKSDETYICSIIDDHGRNLLDRTPWSYSKEYSEILAMILGLQIAQERDFNTIYSESKRIVEYWSRGHINPRDEYSMDEQMLLDIERCKDLRQQFESRGGQVSYDLVT